MSQTRFEPLTVVGSRAGIAEFAESAYRSEIPGFQISENVLRGIGMMAIVRQIEDASLRVIGTKIPFTALSSNFVVNNNHLAPHIDGSFRGLAVHHNGIGDGSVELAHLKDSQYQPGNDNRFFKASNSGTNVSYRGQGISAIAEASDTIYTGTLAPHRLTVFSEGNIPGLQPTIHHFHHDGANRWTRYASAHINGMKTPAEYQRAVDGFAYQVIQREAEMRS